MANDFYNPSGYPAPNAPGASASMRAELDLIEQGFEKLPQLTGNANRLVSVNETATGLVANDDIGQVDFDQAGGSDAVARLVWSDTDGTLNLGLKGGNVVLQVGQEEVLRVLNTTGSPLTSGQAVYIVGASGQRPTVALAQANAEMTSSKVLGIVTESIANNAQGFVTTAGLVRGINTITLTEGALVFVSATVAGGLTATRPTQPNHSVMVGYCVRSHATEGIIYTLVQNGYELDELHDVLITSVAANNMLRRNAANTVWENIPGPAGAVVGTTDTQTLTNKTISGGTVTGAVVTGLATPTAASDAASKAYVDSVAEGLDAKASCRVATTANITLSGAQTIDGVSAVAGNRVLVKNQTASQDNGIYVVAAGAWARSSDANTWDELVSAFTFVELGTTQTGNGYISTVSAGGTLGSTAVTWTQFSSAGETQPGAGLSRTGNTLNVGTASSARIVVNADNIDLATTAVTPGTYRSLAVDAYGRATGGTNPTTLAGYAITDAYTKTYIDTLYGDTASAAASAAAAAASYDAFDDRWLGAKTSDPTVDNDGNPLQAGAVYFSTTLQEMRVWTGLAWQVATTLPNGVFKNNFTATAGQTSYTWTGGGSYNPAFLYVYVNGVLLSANEYTATNGANISFSTGLTLGDEVQLMSFKAAGTFTAGDISFTPAGGVAATNVQAAIAEVDAEAVKLAGDQTIAGTKTFSSTISGSVSGNAGTVTNGVYTTGDQTIAGTKTFSSTVVGSINGNAGTATALQTARTIGGVSFDGTANINLPGVNTAGNQNTSGTASNVTGTVAIANGGTGSTTASAAFTALKQDATTTATGVVELATSAEAAAGTDTARAITPATLFGGLNATGSAPIYACRAWVNFNGTGTVAIRASGNVTSITDNGAGSYNVNFATAMPDANYSAVVTTRRSTGADMNVAASLAGATTPGTNYPLATNTCTVWVGVANTGVLTDFDLVCVSIFR